MDAMTSAAPLTLPQLAGLVGIEYRTLHNWLRRGLVRPSLQASRGTGSPNLFTQEDAVKVKVIADLRQAGLSFELLLKTSAQLDSHASALNAGAMVLVNGAVVVADAKTAAATIARESLTLVYNTEHAIKTIESSLAEPVD